MNLKILSICSVISLLYGENLFASVKDMVRQYETNLEKRQEDTSYKYNKDRKMAEIKKQTSDVSVKDLAEKFGGQVQRTNSSRVQDLKQSEKDEHPVSDSRAASAEQFANGENSASNSQEALMTDEFYSVDGDSDKTGSEESLSEKYGSSSADFKKFAENLEAEVSASKQMMDKFDQQLNDFSDSLSDSESTIEQQEKAESLKKAMVDWNNKLVDQIDELEQIMKDFENLEMEKKIKQLNEYRVKLGNMSMNMTRKISQIQINRRKAEKAQKKEQKQQAERMMKSIDWQAIKKYNDEDLSAFVQAVRNYKLRLSVVQRYGKKCFEDQDGSALFDPGQKMEPSLKGLCKQINQVRFPEAIKVWSEIKEMQEKDPNYAAKLDELRAKIIALGKNVSSLIKQGYKEPAESQND